MQQKYLTNINTECKEECKVLHAVLHVAVVT